MKNSYKRFLKDLISRGICLIFSSYVVVVGPLLGELGLRTGT